MKRLVKSSKDRVITGVCGGVGEYLGIDPVIVRLVMVVLFFMAGTGLLAYLVAAFIMPSAEALPEQTQDQAREAQEYDRPMQQRPQSGEQPPPRADVVPLLIGGFLVLLGAFFMTRNIPVLNHYYWWLYHHVRPFFWPGLIMGVGLLLILRGSKTSNRLYPHTKPA